MTRIRLLYSMNTGTVMADCAVRAPARIAPCSPPRPSRLPRVHAGLFGCDEWPDCAPA